MDRLAELAARLLSGTSAQVQLLPEAGSLLAGAVGAVVRVPVAPSPRVAGEAGRPGASAEAVCRLTVVHGEPVLVDDAATHPQLTALHGGASGSHLAVPLRTSTGAVAGALCVSAPAPRAWGDDDVELLRHVAAAVVAELELSSVTAEYQTGKVVWELALEAAGVGTFDLDVASGTLTWDDRLLVMFGYDADTFGHTLQAFNDRLHPDDLPRVTTAIEGALARGGEFAAEYRVVLPDGTTRWVAGRGRALRDTSGVSTRLLGVAYDTTAVHEGEARLVRLLESVTAAFFTLDTDWRFAYVNAEAERVLGRSRDELLGGVVWELFPAAVGTDFEANYRGAVETGQPVSFQAYYPQPLDAWYEIRAWPVPDGLSVSFLDITAQRRAQELADRVAQRLALLSDVTSELAGTLEPEEAVARLAQLVVPSLCDWSIVTLVEDENAGQLGLRDISSWHVDPPQRPLLDRYVAERLPGLSDGSFLLRALESGQPVVVGTDATAAVAAVLRPGPARDLLEELAPASLAVLPLVARGRTVGLLSLFNGPERGSLAQADLGTASEVAVRAALALDNARLYAAQRRLAEALQRSLLTEPPEPDHTEVVVRYTPAAQAAQVGGDWYDAFLQPDGATSLVIGDVVGHDTAAAAAMGQVRGLLRGIAVSSGAAPAEVLHKLDQAMETLQVRVTASVVVARLEQSPDQLPEGTTTVRWSNAGHPPPLVLHADGRVELLTVDEPDLLLGIDPPTPRTDHVVTLQRGSTVLLYTDGLVEERAQPLDVGLDRLVRTVAEIRDLPLAELCDTVLARMLPARPADDVALVAVRLHRQDRPRPAEAGPRDVPADVPPDPAEGQPA